MQVTLVRATEAPLEAVAAAAAVCYDSIPSTKIVKHCYDSGHLSVFEFADFHFHVRGISRAASHQLVRHRMASYAQRSQRYTDESDFEFIRPRKMDGHKSGFYQAINTITKVYKDGLAAGHPAEDVRYILPNACVTELHMKMNLRSFINFCNLRLCTRAQWEIRELAQKMVDVLVERFPELKPYLVPKCEAHAPYTFCTERECCGRQPKLKDAYGGCGACEKK